MSGNRVLVTGASRGIGRAIALKLGERGWSVAVHYSAREAEAREVAVQLGDRASGIYQCDLSDTSKASGLWSDVTADGEVHALVNNAGVYLPLDFVGSDDADFMANWRQMFAVNFESPLFLTRAATRTFAGAGAGKVLNVASRVGFKGEGGAAMYAASKAALINLTRSLAVELASKNIGMFGIAPGWVDTSMARDGMEDRLPDIIATLPLGRMGSPDDCAEASAFLLSDGAAYLSGQVIDINGASYFH